MGFGDFEHLCKKVPSYPWCNLFYRQLQRASNGTLTGLSIPAASAPVGVNPERGIPRNGYFGSVGNVANTGACALNMLNILYFVYKCRRRREALGRVEFSTFLLLYYCSLALKLITVGSFAEQGSQTLVIFTAIHAGVVVALFGALLVNAFLALRIVEDGVKSTLYPFYTFLTALGGLGIYVSLDIANGLTHAIGGLSSPPERLTSVALFVLTTIWPATCAVFYLAVMIYTVLFVLEDAVVPLWYFLLAAFFFVASQVAWFVIGGLIFVKSHSKIDASFIVTTFETVAVIVLYLAWELITED